MDWILRLPPVYVGNDCRDVHKYAAVRDTGHGKAPDFGHEKKRVMGIEPTYPAWKAGVLPLNYTRVISDTCDIIPHH